MPLESATYIDDLVVTNPDAGDVVAQGDDHLRLLKSVLKNTFPNIDAAVSASVAQINGWEARIAAVESTYIKKDGSVAFTGTVAGVTPVSNAHLVTKLYVDSIVKVTSFNTRTGVVTLTSLDVTDALGYTPWHPGNDGAGSGLDADLLDGLSSAHFTDINARFIAQKATAIGIAPRPSNNAGDRGNWIVTLATPPTTTVPGVTGQRWAYFYVAGSASIGGDADGGSTISTPIDDSPVLFWRVD